jgi:alkanesulfonate monooxygenase SsuD/methylene tetrahydromethanopterin reductase-like flavin-dependent oxidoreductase (luciferase family)
VNLWPKPIQKPHPPVWIPGGGSVETWRWTAERNYSYSYLSYSGHKRGKAVLDGYWQTLDEMGIARNPYRCGFLQLVCIGENDEDARKMYEEAVDYFYDKCLHIFEGFSEAPGYRSIKTIEAGIQNQFGRQGRQARQGMGWQDYIDGGFIIAGGPDTVREKLKEVAKDLNVGQLMLLQHIGNLSQERTLKATELFAKKVLPDMREVHAEWEDSWYPNSLAERARPRATALAR